MLSILIIDNEVFDHYNKYEYFLDRFEAEGDVAVCVWNKGAFEEDIVYSVVLERGRHFFAEKRKRWRYEKIIKRTARRIDDMGRR